MENLFIMIPARIGSQRLKKKNLKMISGLHLIEYTIINAINSKLTKNIYINSDSIEFKKIAKNNNIHFYKRNKKLGGNNIKSDDVVYDFFQNFKNCKKLIWLNPIAPLTKISDIKKSINYFNKNKITSFISTNSYQVHALAKNKPINFIIENKFQKTQDLKPIKLFNYAVMIWERNSFIKLYEKNGYAFITNKFGSLSTSFESGILIKRASDFQLAKKILKASN